MTCRRLFFAGFVLASVAAAEDGGAPRPRPRRPNWQAKLSTFSIASVARREGRREWNEITQGNKASALPLRLAQRAALVSTLSPYSPPPPHQVVLPRSVYEYLSRHDLPLDKFQLLNPASRALRLYTAPLDFCAAEGECYLPSWVMRQLGLKEGEACAVATACFPSAAFIKFQPHSSARARPL